MSNVAYFHGVSTFITFTALCALITGQTQYVSWSVCQEMQPKSNATGVDDTFFGPTTTPAPGAAINCSRSDVSAKSAQILQVVQLVNSLPGIMVTGTMGFLSDAYGRKPVMLVGMCTLLASSVVTLITAWFKWTYWWIVVAQAISGLTGNYVVILLAVFASVSDISDGATRTVNVALTEGGVYLGAATGSVIFGQFAKRFPFDADAGWQLFAFVVALFVAALVCVGYGLKETLPRGRRVPFPGLLRANTLSSVFALGRSRTLITLTVVFTIQCCTYFGYLQIIQLYTETFFGWTPQRLGYFSMVTYLCGGIGMLVFIPLFGTFMKSVFPAITAFGRDKTILYMTVLLGVGQYIGFGLVPAASNPRSQWLSFAIASVSILVGVQPPVMRAMFSKQFPAHELGLVFGAIATLESVLQLLWPVVIEQIYHESFKTPAITTEWHATIYYVGAGLSLLSFFILGTLPKDAKEFELASDGADGESIPAGSSVPPGRKYKSAQLHAVVNGDTFDDEVPLLR